MVPEKEHVRWQDRDLNVGDNISIKVIETDDVDAPTKRYTRDPKKDARAQKQYVKMMAKKFGWKIQTKRK